MYPSRSGRMVPSFHLVGILGTRRARQSGPCGLSYRILVGSLRDLVPAFPSLHGSRISSELMLRSRHRPRPAKVYDRSKIEKICLSNEQRGSTTCFLIRAKNGNAVKTEQVESTAENTATTNVKQKRPAAVKQSRCLILIILIFHIATCEGVMVTG